MLWLFVEEIGGEISLGKFRVTVTARIIAW